MKLKCHRCEEMVGVKNNMVVSDENRYICKKCRREFVRPVASTPTTSTTSRRRRTNEVATI